MYYRWLACVVIVWGCAGGTVGGVDAGAEAEAGFDSGQTDVRGNGGDVYLGAPDVPEDSNDFELPGDVVLTDGDIGADPGEAGYPCSGSADCISGFCIQTANGKQCTINCIEECPFGWLCSQYDGGGTDLVFICVPRFVNLCRPCMTNDECRADDTYNGVRCVDYGPAGNFCGGPCDEDADCPAGHTCAQSIDVTGAAEVQCVLKKGECGCTQRFADEGAWTECYNENEWGICDGERGCLATGLEPCPAQAPEAESCNGMDDDCDDAIDEGTGGAPCLVENEFGLCPGETLCIDGETGCNGDGAEPEACDGIDNDCDGTTDESFEDTDGDGIADCMENDKDGDEVVDGEDNCPSTPNPGQEDHDFDNFGDACDADDDNDETPDVDDCAPLNKSINPDAEEICDGLDNDCNLLVDEGFADTDADSWKDCVDEDDDNDLALDGADCAPLDKTIHPAALELCDGTDNNCNDDVDEGYADLDGDGAADCVDEDADGDEVPDAQDNCPLTVNPDQEDSDDDGLGDACDIDLDGDGVPGELDNCPVVFNPSQSDVDDDGDGDLCDSDDDGDGLPDDEDNCPLIANPEQEDGDSDGVGDACAGDDDGDGTPDELDCAPLNPGIHPDALEECDGVDNNCNALVDEGFPDTDLDGLKDCVDGDTDGDGAPNELDCAPLDAAISPGAAEACNGIDDDCNDKVDDALGELTCGTGECLHSVAACQVGKPQFCNPFEGAVAEFCDGKDNDCDGTGDEELGSSSCGIGKCQHTVANCLAGEPQECDPLLGAEEEVCDGADNDCDGLIDEALGVLTCGQGECLQVLQLCVNGEEAQCDPLNGAAPEFCDGKDNDCDGLFDEELPQIMCGQGECLHSLLGCVEGEVPVCYPLEGAADEVCDGKDNNCDGEIDNNLGMITCGLGECQELLPMCTEGQKTFCDPFAGATNEVCDGKDNDCDGFADEDLADITCGLGICEHTVASCVGGVPNQCDPLAGSGEELCDDLDNDCDGETDPPDTSDCVIFYADLDVDGYGVEGDSACLCAATEEYPAAQAGDCDDESAMVNPGMEEQCDNAVDDNCADGVNEGCIYGSCGEILVSNPDAETGEYSIDPDGEGGNPPVTVYCEMLMAGGGWMRIANVDTDASASCPGNWQYDAGPKACRRPGQNCHSAFFGPWGVTWTELRGQVLAYQYNSMDAFHMYNPFGLDGPYVDGVSVTWDAPRKHVWTYAVGISEDGNYPDYNCPCAKYPGSGPPGFVGTNYYCESGNAGNWEDAWYTGDTLYDGGGCPSGNNCCADNALPWFQRDIGQQTTGDVEVRLCSDQEPGNEDVGLKRLELFVR